MIPHSVSFSFFFFFNDTATTEIYTLSLHDALPIYPFVDETIRLVDRAVLVHRVQQCVRGMGIDRKSTRLNSSHVRISYAVFCLKKKKNTTNNLATLPIIPRSATTTPPHHHLPYRYP